MTVSAPPLRLARSIAARVDEILAALDEPTPARIEALADFTEQEACQDRDAGRAAMGRAFAAELRARAARKRQRLS